jgi:hypothetical protein
MARSHEGEFAKLNQQIVDRIERTYCGDLSDIEGREGTDFCTVNTYADKKDTLKAKFKKLEEDIRVPLGWNPVGCVDRVVDADPDDMPEFWAAPWQVGYTDGHSVKGMSKLVHILDIIDGFFSKPYASKSDPLQVIFGPGSKVADAVPDWSMVISVGMGKASACRMILEAVSEMNLSVHELLLLAANLKALLCMRCTYDPVPNEEEQMKKAMSITNQVTGIRARIL